MQNCPLTNVVSPDAEPVIVEETGTGWHFRAAAGLSGWMRGMDDALVCRVAPGEDREVVQLAIGPATSRLCNAVYSPGLDTAFVFAGDEVCVESLDGDIRVRVRGPLTVAVHEHFYRLHHGLPWFAPLDRAVFPRPPAGWCSWYYYYLGITEQEVVKNTDWLAEHLLPFGCTWVQIDDGWQGRGDGYGTNRDWFSVSDRDFPMGMRWIADYIREKAMRPGIWCIPFAQSNEQLFRDQPALFVHRPDGVSPGERDEPLPYDWMLPESERMYEWAGRYYIDPTGEKGQGYLRTLMEMLCVHWGYDYVKIDGQSDVARQYAAHRRNLADPSLSGDRAYRHGLSALTSVLGPDRFLLNCGSAWDSAGLCQGIRIGGDVDLHTGWAGLQNAFEQSMRWLFLNTIAFYTDPDVVCVREPLPLEQARLWATFVALTGQLLMTSDRMYALPDERVELLRRIFPVADIRPMELYPLDAMRKPGIFDVKVQRPEAGQWDVVGLFNWDEEWPRGFALSPARLGLPEGDWLITDGVTGELLHDGDGNITFDLAPTTCRVVAYWPRQFHPQFVGSSRHITQGATDLETLAWDESTGTLAGTSHVVGGDTYRVRIHVPAGWRTASAGLQRLGELVEYTIERPANETVRWSVSFARA